MEYSTISMMDYFYDTLANVGLPEAWLEWESNDPNQTENKCVKCESNLIKKAESNPSKKHESNQVGNGDLNQVGNNESNKVWNDESIKLEMVS